MREDSCPNDSGSDAKEVAVKISSVVRDNNCPKDSGSDVKDLQPLTFRVVREDSCPSDSGSDAKDSQLFKLSVVREASSPTDSGSVDKKDDSFNLGRSVMTVNVEVRASLSVVVNHTPIFRCSSACKTDSTTRASTATNQLIDKPGQAPAESV